MKSSDVIATISVPVNITVERVKNLLCNAIEGSSDYWVEYMDRKGGITQEQAPYRQDVPFVDGGWLELKEWEEDGKGRTFEIRKENIIKGLTIMAEKYPNAFADFINENDDAETSDTFLQCICFGETIYG